MSSIPTKPIFGLNPSTLTVADFEQGLLSHDWFYSYSDDHRYYEQGQKESMWIRLARTSLEDRGELSEEQANEMVAKHRPKV